MSFHRCSLSSTGCNRSVVSCGLISPNQSLFWQNTPKWVSASEGPSLLMSNRQLSLGYMRYSRPMLMIYCLFCLFLFYVIQQPVCHAGAPCGGFGTCFIYPQGIWVLPYWRSRGHYKPVLIFVLLHTQKKTFC